MKNQKVNNKGYLKDSQAYILFIVSLFTLSIIIGIINANILQDLINPLLQDIINKTENLNAFQLIVYIFVNNALTSFIGILSGIFLGIMPLITTISNGVILGYVLERVTQIAGIAEIWRLFPHGIFELPAVFISLGLGLKLGIKPLANYLNYYKKNKLLTSLPFFIALFLSILTASTLNNIEKNKALSDIPENLLTPFLALSAIIFYFALTFIIFILFTALKDKKLRKIQIASFKANITNSIKLFFRLIIPLLLIAAIIEGLLITVL